MQTQYIDMILDYSNIDMIPLNISDKNKKVISISLFPAKKYVDSAIKKYLDNEYPYSIGYDKSFDSYFYDNYLMSQLISVQQFFDNPHWEDYGIVHSIDNSLFQMPMIFKVYDGTREVRFFSRKDSDLTRYTYGQTGRVKGMEMYLIDEKCPLDSNELMTVGDYIVEYTRIRFDMERYDLYLYKYKLPFFTESIRYSDLLVVEIPVGFYGTLVRFIPFIIPKYDVVLIRDAHSTFPSVKYRYDRDWHRIWEASEEGTIKMIMYHAANYNPVHLKTMRGIFAAIWGARKFRGEYSIFSESQYKSLFSFKVPVDHDMIKYKQNFFADSSYGIDERVLIKGIANYDYKGPNHFLSSCFLIGIVFALYLVQGQKNPRFYDILIPTKPSYEQGMVFNTLQNIGPVAMEEPYHLKPSYNPSISSLSRYQTDPSTNLVIAKKFGFINPDYSFYEDGRCIILLLCEELSKKLNKRKEEITCKEFFDNVDILKGNYNPNLGELSSLVREYMKVIPQRYNIWEYLFFVPGLSIDQQFDEKRQTIFGLFTKYGLNSESNMNIENLCHINEKFTSTYPVLDYDKYILNTGENIKDLENPLNPQSIYNFMMR